jgi:toxin ParE1/3/4
MRVRLTDAARQDIVEIVKWIAKDSPVRARSFGKELIASCRALKDFPEAFPIVATKFGGEIRRKTHGNYLIFYNISGKVVQVVHVIQGARDFDPLVD